MEQGRKRQGQSSGRGVSTKYVFAGSHEREEESGVKVCPQCGEVLFADMDTCFGCLYDFTRERPQTRELSSQRPRLVQGGMAPPRSASDAGTASPVTAGHSDDPLAGIELDEIDGIDEEGGIDVALEDDAQPADAAPLPRHGKRPDSAEDTLDLSDCDLTVVSPPQAPSRPTRPAFRIVADCSDMLVRMSLPEKGLMVGRGESNDIVLRSRSVSRSHLRLVPLEDAVLAQDCGATNPATLEGKPLEGTAKVHAGQFIMICGASIGVEEGLPDPAA